MFCGVCFPVGAICGFARDERDLVERHLDFARNLQIETARFLVTRIFLKDW